MTSLFHITQEDAWLKARSDGVYTAPSIETEGFIHLSEETQVLATANRFYQGMSGLVLLEIDSEQLTSRLQYDDVLDHGRFPHLYGPLNLDAIVRVIPFTPEEDGLFISWDAGCGTPPG